MKRQPYFFQLYNLHLSGEIPPTQVEKQALAKVVYWHCNFNPLAPSDGNSYPPTGAISVRDGDSQVALFQITQDNLQYCHPNDTSKEPLKDWWQEDYQSFINEYKHLRAFVDGYIEGEIQRTDLEWLDEAIGNITRKLYYFYNAEPKIPLPVGPFFSTIPVGKKFNLKHFTFFTNPKYSALQTPTKKMFSKVYLELTDILENPQTIRQCKAPKTQKSSACQNIFIPYEKGKEQLYCSPKCTNRVRRRKYYKKHQK